MQLKIGFPYEIKVDRAYNTYVYLGMVDSLLWFCNISNMATELFWFGVEENIDYLPVNLLYDQMKIEYYEVLDDDREVFFKLVIEFNNNELVSYEDTNGNWWDINKLNSPLYFETLPVDFAFYTSGYITFSLINNGNITYQRLL